jgi:hypothetical protein
MLKTMLAGVLESVRTARHELNWPWTLCATRRRLAEKLPAVALGVRGVTGCI